MRLKLVRKGVTINTKTTEEVEATTEKVLEELKKAILTKDIDTSRKLLFWLNTWGSDYLLNEQSFNYHSLIAYKRGMVVKADFGFNVGSEQGGLHYALVIEKENAKSNRTVTVIPLGSLSDDKTPKDIDEKYEVFLGYSLFKEEISKVQKIIANKESHRHKLVKYKQPLGKIDRDLKNLRKKLQDYKKGTVAILSQICALSKIRIHTPKNSGDELFNFTLEDKLLEVIDRKLLKIYLDEKNVKDLLTSVEE